MIFRALLNRKPEDYSPDVSFETRGEVWNVVEAIYDNFPPSVIIQFCMMRDSEPRRWLIDHIRIPNARKENPEEFRLSDIDCATFIKFLRRNPSEEWFVHLFVNDDTHSLVTIFDWTTAPNQVDVNSVIGDERVKRFREALET